MSHFSTVKTELRDRTALIDALRDLGHSPSEGERPVPVERFLAQLTQRYALRSILAASAEEGFQVSEQRQAADGSIELVVTRWDG